VKGKGQRSLFKTAFLSLFFTIQGMKVKQVKSTCPIFTNTGTDSFVGKGKVGSHKLTLQSNCLFGKLL